MIQLPFYGGAKGSILRFVKNKNGTISTEISEAGSSNESGSSEEKLADNSPSLVGSNSFADNLMKIQKAAQKLVAIQQVVKASGKISTDERKTYVDNLDTLGQAAQALAQMNSATDADDFRLLISGERIFIIFFLFHRRFNNFYLSGDKYTGAKDKNRKNKFPDFPPFTPITKENEDTEESVGEETGGLFTGFDRDSDTVQVNSPNKDASVAEAKPVGLAIAGVGGVASSKPSATAVVGPGGLAIARPSAVAIAGVSPDDVSNLGIPIPQKKIIKKNYSSLASRASGSAQSLTEMGKYGVSMMHTPYGDIKVLIGPDYKDPNAPSTAALKTTMDYSKDQFNQQQNTDDGEILAEDYQDTEESKVKETPSGSPFVSPGVAKYDDLMAVAPEENILNRYPLIPPKFTGYSKPTSRNSNQAMNLAAINPAIYYQPLPAAAASPYNYPFANLPFQGAPMYFGY